MLPFDQFVFAGCQSEENELRLRRIFATHQGVVRGHALRRIEMARQRVDLPHLACLAAKYRGWLADRQPFIREIAVQEVKDSEAKAIAPSN